MECVINKHEFAFYVENLSSLLSLSKNCYITISDRLLCDRLYRILRIQDGQFIVLFDRFTSSRARFDLSYNATKKSVSLFIVESLSIARPMPSITALLPLLKKDAFEQAMYSMQVCGVSRVVPLITDRVHKNWWSDRTQKRLNNILVSAAEQSKNFSFLDISSPISLSSYLNSQSLDCSFSFYFDASGKPLLNAMVSISENKPTSITLMWGPEGDCSQSEKELLRKAGFQFISLGNTVLRAKDAVLLGLGSLRSVNYSS